MVVGIQNVRIDMDIKEVNKEVQKYPETIFDTFDLSIDLRNTGSALREDLVNLSNLYGRINQLATNALFLYEQAKNKRDRIESIAWERVDKSEKITKQKILIRTVDIFVDGEKTSLNEEEERVNMYFYIHSRGKDKVKEISAILDVARTLLSWDKLEQSKVNY
jgi:hypothetical protein